MAAFKQTHPMSGGVGRVLVDHVEDYRKLRSQRFGFGMLPLPLSIAAPEVDSANSRLPVAQAITA
jgi:hypothetical protein